MDTGSREELSSADRPFVLVINGAEEHLQIVLGKAGDVIHFREMHAPARAMHFLAPAVDQILRDHAVPPDLIRRICCVNGPGSFTGLRLTLSTA
ncbi:MAG: hypothetical protein ACOC0U_00485, partial [Desulfovibrionales bacterium]